MTAQEVLKTYFGYDAFRPLQAEIIDSVLAGRDTLALMPTGGGKSICFQVPTLVKGLDNPEKRLCLVITPLIALMRDQVANLQARGIHAAAVYTGMTWDKQRVALDNCLYGPYHFLYCSPERLESEEFRKRLKDLPVGLIAVDEAHCISQWGYDFRPSYLNIAAVRELLPDVPVLALTATATPETIDDIQAKLGFKEPNVLRKSFRRENLCYIVRRTENKEEQVAHILSRVPGSAIVYVRNRKRAQELAEWLNVKSQISNVKSSDYYHAGLTTKERNERQEAWTEGRTRVIVATNAFGMGIDKPDVRVVIHYDLPSHLESYYQEAGRAGRDGKTAYAVLLYNEAEDKAKLKKRAVDTYPPKEFVEQVYHKTMDFLQIGAGSGYGHRFPLHIDQLCHVMKLPVIQTYSALHILTHAGYIDFEEEHETQPRVQILVPRHQLGEYNLSYEQAELLDVLMRSYSGIYTDLQYVREADQMSNEKSQISNVKSQMSNHDILVSLAKRGIITYIPRSIGCSLTMTNERQTEIYLSPAIFEDRQQRFISKLQAMLEYADQTQFCREQVLLAYFGEKNAVPCGHCDVCRELERITLQPM